MKTVFTTPVVRQLLAVTAKLFLLLSGWKAVGATPEHPKYVLIGAPHTSNWDFVLMLCVVLSRGMEIKWMGKQQLFKPPFGGLMKWLGGIPIERSQSHNTVDKMVDTFAGCDSITLLITPEGTRSKVREWKTGFYRIAEQAEIPIVQGFLDSATKSCGFGPTFHPSGNIDQDLEAIKSFYRDKLGVRPELGVSENN